MTLSIVGFDDLVTSFVATIATGWSDPCRVGLSPTRKPRLSTAHSGNGVTFPAPSGRWGAQTCPDSEEAARQPQISPGHPLTREEMEARDQGPGSPAPPTPIRSTCGVPCPRARATSRTRTTVEGADG